MNRVLGSYSLLAPSLRRMGGWGMNDANPFSFTFSGSAPTTSSFSPSISPSILPTISSSFSSSPVHFPSFFTPPSSSFLSAPTPMRDHFVSQQQQQQQQQRSYSTDSSYTTFSPETPPASSPLPPPSQSTHSQKRAISNNFEELALHPKVNFLTMGDIVFKKSSKDACVESVEGSTSIWDTIAQMKQRNRSCMAVRASADGGDKGIVGFVTELFLLKYAVSKSCDELKSLPIQELAKSLPWMNVDSSSSVTETLVRMINYNVWHSIVEMTENQSPFKKKTAPICVVTLGDIGAEILRLQNRFSLASSEGLFNRTASEFTARYSIDESQFIEGNQTFSSYLEILSKMEDKKMLWPRVVMEPETKKILGLFTNRNLFHALLLTEEERRNTLMSELASASAVARSDSSIREMMEASVQQGPNQQTYRYFLIVNSLDSRRKTKKAPPKESEKIVLFKPSLPITTDEVVTVVGIGDLVMEMLNHRFQQIYEQNAEPSQKESTPMIKRPYSFVRRGLFRSRQSSSYLGVGFLALTTLGCCIASFLVFSMKEENVKLETQLAQFKESLQKLKYRGLKRRREEIKEVAQELKEGKRKEGASVDFFLSYRRGTVGSLHHSLCDKLGTLRYADFMKREITTFLDDRCLTPGKPFDEDFVSNLARCTIFTPLISNGAFDRLETYTEGVDGPIDHLLLEWDLSLELYHSGKIKAIIPLFFGEEDFDSEKGYTPFDFGRREKLPQIVHLPTKRRAKELLNELGIQPSPDFEERTIVSVVDKMTMQHGILLWTFGNRNEAQERCAKALIKRLGDFEMKWKKKG